MDEDHPAVPGGYPLSQATFETGQLSSSDDDHETQAWPDGGDHSHSAQSVRPGADLKLDPAFDGSSVHLDTVRSMDATQDETRHHHEGSQHVHVDVEPTHSSIHHVHNPEEGATWRGSTPPTDYLAVPPEGQQSHRPHPHAHPQQHFLPAHHHHGRHPSASHDDHWVQDQHGVQYEPFNIDLRSTQDPRLTRARGRQSNKPRSKQRPASRRSHDHERRSGRTYEQPQVQVIVPGQIANSPAPANPQSGSVAGALTEQMQMMMMSQMMMQQMAAQQIQAAQLSAITDQSGDKDKKGKKTKRPSINIKSKQVNKRRHSMPMIMPPVAVRPVEPQNTIEASAMENWQEATIILCIAIVGLIYLVSSRSAKNDKEEASLAANHLVPKS